MTKVLDGLLLRGFLETAKQGSIGRAASALGQTQPALSQQLRRLEDITESTLFMRSRRGVHLTPEGEKLRPYAERILELNIEHRSLGATFN